MKNRLYSRFIVPKWVKWGIGVVCLVLVSCFIYSVYLYYEVQQNKTARYENIKENVLQSTDISTIEKIEQYHGEKAYFILYGVTDDNKQKLIFYPSERKKEDLTIIEKSEIIPEETIKKGWNSQCKNCELIEIAPAIVDDKPVWEITFIDSSNRYVIDYLSIYDAKRIEQIRLKQMYK